MPFVFVKSINAYNSKLYWKNLTIIKTYVIFYPILAAILKKKWTVPTEIHNFNPRSYHISLVWTYWQKKKILFIMIFKKKYILAHP